MADLLGPLLHDLKIKTAEDVPATSESNLPDVKAIDLNKTDEQLMDLYARSRSAESAASIVLGLKANGGKPVALVNIDGTKDVIAQYDAPSDTFLVRSRDGKDALQEFPADRFGAYVELQGLRLKLATLARRGHKVTLDAQGNQEKSETSAFVPFTIQGIEDSLPAMSGKVAVEKEPTVSADGSIVTERIIPEGGSTLLEQATTDESSVSALEDKVNSDDQTAIKEVVSSAMEASDATKSPFEKTVSEQGVKKTSVQKEIIVADTDAPEVREEDVEAIQAFEPKSDELRAYLSQGHLVKFKGAHKTEKYITQLSDNIRRAAVQVIEGGDIQTVMTSLGLDKAPHSKTVARNLPGVLAAELKAHQMQKEPFEDVAAVPEAIVDSQPEHEETEKMEQVSGVTDQEAGVKKETAGEVVSLMTAAELLESQQGTDAPVHEAMENLSAQDETLKPAADKEEGVQGSQELESDSEEMVGHAVSEKELTENEAVSNEQLFGGKVSVEEFLLDDQIEEIALMKAHVDAARSEYVRMDYKQTTARDKVRRFFGKNLFKDIDEDVIAMKEAYQSALTDYTNARLEMARIQSGSSEELLKKNLVEVLREIEVQERVNVYDARVNVKTPDWMMGAVQKTVDWYRGLSLKERLAFSAVMIAGGAALGMTVGAGAASAAFLARRGFGGAVAGRGIFQFGEDRSQKTSQKEFDASIRDAQKEMAFTQNPEDMIRQVQERLAVSVGTIDTKLNSMMKSRTRSTAAGFAAGAFLGFGAPQYLMEKFQVFGSAAEVSPTASMPPIENAPLARAIVENATEHMEKPIELAIQAGTGQSIEGQLIHHLVASGHDKLEAGKMAHRMVIDYVHDHAGVTLESLDHVVGGEKIALSANGLHIEDITKNIGRAVADHSTVIHSKVMASAVNLMEHHAGVVAGHVEPQTASVPTDVFGYGPASESFSAQPTDVFGNAEVVKHSADTAQAAVPEMNMHTGEFEMSGVGLTAEQNAEIIRLATPHGLMGELAGGKQSVWQDMKNLTLEQIRADQSGQYKKVLAVMAKYAGALGENMPKIDPDKTMLQWVAKVANAVNAAKA